MQSRGTLLVCGKKQIEGRSLLDLGKQFPRRTHADGDIARIDMFGLIGRYGIFQLRCEVTGHCNTQRCISGRMGYGGDEDRLTGKLDFHGSPMSASLSRHNAL